MVFSITVAEMNQKTERSSDDVSLASSSIIMPTPALTRGTAPSDTATVETQDRPASPGATSNVTVKTETTADDAISDVGSDASSVSLISVPSSEDEDDEIWQDSRSHVVVPEPERARAAMEYVVIYDEGSSEEESG
jgi:hypothetical protein